MPEQIELGVFRPKYIFGLAKKRDFSKDGKQPSGVFLSSHDRLNPPPKFQNYSHPLIKYMSILLKPAMSTIDPTKLWRQESD